MFTGYGYLQIVDSSGGGSSGLFDSVSMAHGGTGWETLTHSIGEEARLVNIYDIVAEAILYIPWDKNVSDVLNEIRIYSDVALTLEVNILAQT